MSRSGSEKNTEQIDEGRGRQGLKRMLLALLAVVLLPAGGLAIGQAVNGFNEEQALRDASLSALFRSNVEEEEALLNSAHKLLKFAGDDVLSVRDQPAACNALHERLANVDIRFGTSNFTDRSGYVTCGSGDFSEPVYVGDRPGFQERMAAPGPRVRVIFSRVSLATVVVVSELLMEAGEPVGAISISIPARTLDQLAKASDEDDKARFAILPAGAWGGKPIAEDFGGAGWLPKELPEDIGSVDTPTIWQATAESGEPYVYASGPIRHGGLAAIAGWPVAEVGTNLTLRAAVVVSLPIITWLLVSAVLYLALDRMVIDNIESLTMLARRLRRGDLSARSELPVAAPAEFEALGADLDEMADQIQARNVRLQKAVLEEKLLLREIYHRVKNNLQMIISLLNLQEREATSAEARETLRRAHDRVQSIALAEQSVYQIGPLSEARLDKLLEQIASALAASPRPGFGRVDMRLDLEPVAVDAELVVAASLFATEAMTSAIQACCADGQSGWLKVSVRPDKEAGFILTISNSLPPAQSGGEQPQEGSTEGLAHGSTSTQGAGGRSLYSRLMENFARQLRGELSVSSEDGVHHVRLATPNARPARTVGSATARPEATRRPGGDRHVDQ